MINWNLEVGVSDQTMIAVVNEAAIKGTVIKVHLHVDTGMRRFGCRPEETLRISTSYRELPFFKIRRDHDPLRFR